MSTQPRLPIHPIWNQLLGFETAIKELDKLANDKVDKYPPHNIIKLSDNNYRVELAVAGFYDDELSVVIEDNVLKISGEKKYAKNENGIEYLHKGISTKSFTKTIALVDTVEVIGARLSNGILRITLENIVPKRTPKIIKIDN